MKTNSGHLSPSDPGHCRERMGRGPERQQRVKIFALGIASCDPEVDQDQKALAAAAAVAEAALAD
jgi:hypothetical protein